MSTSPPASAAFYADLLGQPAAETSPTFALFALPSRADARPVVAPHGRAGCRRRPAAAAKSLSPSTAPRPSMPCMANGAARAEDPAAADGYGFRPYLRRARPRRPSPARLLAGRRRARHERPLDRRRVCRACAARPRGRLHAGLPRQGRARFAASGRATASSTTRRPRFSARRTACAPSPRSARCATANPTSFDMGGGFRPFRRDVDWAEARETPITPLLGRLDLTAGKPNWGYQLRFGLCRDRRG